MKLKRNIILSTLLMLTLTSCESVFDYGTDGRVSYDYIFSDYNGTNGYLAKCYAKVPSQSRWRGGNNFLAVFTDEAQDANDVKNSNAFRYYSNEMSSANILTGDIYSSLIEGIRKCNVYLKYSRDDIYFPIESDKTRQKGEALLLRAYLKWQLVKQYGPMPIMNDVKPVDYDYSKDVRPTFYDCVKDIIKDCDEALDNPEMFWRAESAEYANKVNKAFAWALKSQAILFASSYQWDPTGEHKAEAAQITKESLSQLTSNGYDLYKPSVNAYKNKGAVSAYQDLFLIPLDVSATPENKECIFVAKGQFNLWNSYGLPLRASAGVVNCGICPSQELVDAYETTDGEPILDLSKPYLDDDHLIPNYNKNNKLYDPENPYLNRDPRLLSTIIVNGSYLDLTNKKEDVETFVGGNCGISETSEQYTRTGYYLRKFVNWQSKKDVNKDGYWPYFRMAEIYLNFAEADFEANGITSEGKAAIDAVRERVGMPALPDNLTNDEYRLRLRNERRIEFAFEEERFFDLRRWGEQSQFEGIVTGMQIIKDGDKLIYNRKVVQRRDVIDPKYALWPIPRSEELKYQNMGVTNWQNPGWK